MGFCRASASRRWIGLFALSLSLAGCSSPRGRAVKPTAAAPAPARVLAFFLPVQDPPHPDLGLLTRRLEATVESFEGQRVVNSGAVQRALSQNFSTTYACVSEPSCVAALAQPSRASTVVIGFVKSEPPRDAFVLKHFDVSSASLKGFIVVGAKDIEGVDPLKNGLERLFNAHRSRSGPGRSCEVEADCGHPHLAMRCKPSSGVGGSTTGRCVMIRSRAAGE